MEDKPTKLVKVYGNSPKAWALAQPEIDQLKADGYKQVSNWMEGATHVLEWVKFN